MNKRRLFRVFVVRIEWEGQSGIKTGHVISKMRDLNYTCFQLLPNCCRKNRLGAKRCCFHQHLLHLCSSGDVRDGETGHPFLSVTQTGCLWFVRRRICLSVYSYLRMVSVVSSNGVRIFSETKSVCFDGITYWAKLQQNSFEKFSFDQYFSLFVQKERTTGVWYFTI